MEWSLIDHPAFGFYRRLGALRDAVLADLRRRWDLKSAASIASLTPKYLSAFFSEKVSVGFPEWMHLVRVREATRLLSQNNLYIAEVAERVGYGSVETFRRNFRRLVGVPPKVYRDRPNR